MRTRVEYNSSKRLLSISVVYSDSVFRNSTPAQQTQMDVVLGLSSSTNSSLGSGNRTVGTCGEADFVSGRFLFLSRLCPHVPV